MNRCAFSLAGLTPWGRPNRHSSKSFRIGVKRGSEGLRHIGRQLRSEITKAMFPEDLKVSEKKIFDPQDKSLLLWNRLFVISCILAVSVDPLFFYLPIVDHQSSCLGIDPNLAVTTTTVRTIIDAFYLIRMAFQFRTAYIAPSSRVFGRGELVIDPAEIAKRYLQRFFFIDFLAVFPLPQVWQTILVFFALFVTCLFGSSYCFTQIWNYVAFWAFPYIISFALELFSINCNNHMLEHASYFAALFSMVLEQISYFP